MARKILNIIFFLLLCAFAAAFIFPVAVILINSFKAKFSISQSPFTIPTGNDFVGLSDPPFLNTYLAAVNCQYSKVSKQNCCRKKFSKNIFHFTLVNPNCLL